ncbi:hypothetical protein BXZ70DRAFT_378081 [Cristinia sonorae]|uniref:Uncharacterized protein n=1 Tax=Cristinia sonorae TaxID=1940300 RepID=A0A8K0UJW7_9AGAR|nr:hypothetical protein BXZ70DRAFT_378081 [Cristinia sonorae]
MDAIDVAWCLGCNTHIDGSAAYCSKQCQNNHAALSSLPSRYQTPPPLHPHRSHSQLFVQTPSALSAVEDLDFSDDHIDLALDRAFETHHISAKAAWIGKGEAGIYAWARDIPPGPPEDAEELHVKPSSPQAHTFRQPELILSQKRPVRPTLCMSKTIPAPPEPSRPILTPQQSLPSISSHSVTEASLTSLTTALSSLSPATPASPASRAIDDTDPPSAETQKPLTLMGNLTAHLRSWAASSHHSSSGKVKVRSPTVTRRAQETPLVYETFHRCQSPTAFLPDHLAGFPAEKPLSLVEKDCGEDMSCSAFSNKQSYRQGRLEDHPAFRLRGRKAARAVS